MTGGSQEQELRADDGADRRLFALSNDEFIPHTKSSGYNHNDLTITRNNDEEEEEEEEEEGLLSEALLAVASPEDYAAKIVKLQQACLTPLKEDLADWLNKIMNMSTITTENFMDKLDNGVIICHLAKIISFWCEQQLTSREDLPQQTSNNRKTDSVTKIHNPQSFTAPISSDSTVNVHSQTNSNDTYTPGNNTEADYQKYGKYVTCLSVAATPVKQPLSRMVAFTNVNGSSRSSSQSTNCLITSSTTSLNNGCMSGNEFITNLARMEQTKIWEDAKCKTFYARDNVCNFIRWSKEFGVNRSVLFESDDLVLHANPRQVVLCLLDVARIACVKHGFTEAPGLVKFEQEIDRAAAAAAASEQLQLDSTDGYPCQLQLSDNTRASVSASRRLSGLARNSHAGAITDPTDDLIMRYCLHKEEEAVKKKAAELEAAKLKAEEEAIAAAAAAAAATASIETIVNENVAGDGTTETITNLTSQVGVEPTEVETTKAVEDNNVAEEFANNANEFPVMETDSLQTAIETKGLLDIADLGLTDSKVSLGCESSLHKDNLTYDNRVDSLDSGEGRTESASTSHTSRIPVIKNHKSSSIPIPIKRSNSSSSLTSNHTSSMGTSELSSSRSSLLSGQDGNSTSKRHISSDLDGKVMRIAKSYYGKGAKKGVTRLSEGKYKIADRIVFVRLLKGHRVMVRIGGGWDTLENFLFRHKSDPSQVIDVDNLLPLETKMCFEKSSAQPSTPTNSSKLSKLPYYRRSSSASSTNLSISNLSISNHSPTSGSTISAGAAPNTPTNQTCLESPNRQSRQANKQIPYLFIHRGQNSKLTSPKAAFYNQDDSQLDSHYQKSPVCQRRTPSSNRYTNRPLGSSKTPAASATNLYPATLTTRLVSTTVKPPTRLNSTANLYNGRTAKQEAFRKLGRSNDSLQASYYKSPQHRQQQQQRSQQQLQNGSPYHNKILDNNTSINKR